jgi:hypothetical protein
MDSSIYGCWVVEGAWRAHFSHFPVVGRVPWKVGDRETASLGQIRTKPVCMFSLSAWENGNCLGYN